MVVAARVVVVGVVEDFVGEEVVVVVAGKSPWERVTAFDSFERKLDQRGVKNSARIRHSQRWRRTQETTLVGGGSPNCGDEW